MRKMCSTCLEEFNDMLVPITDEEEGGFMTPCPRKNCHGYVIEFKDSDIPLVKTLRQKGYEIIDLDTGTTEDETETVAYVELAFYDKLSILPEGFAVCKVKDAGIVPAHSIDQVKNLVILFSEIQCPTELDLAEEILYCQLALHDWVKLLPDLNAPTCMESKIKGYSKEKTKDLFDEIFKNLSLDLEEEEEDETGE